MMTEIAPGLRWTGIGSRNAPKDLYPTFNRFGWHMAMLGAIFNSGAAEGPDEQLEIGVFTYMYLNRVSGLMQVQLPWWSFGDRDISSGNYRILKDDSVEYKMAATILMDSGVCTWLNAMKNAPRKLFCRNVWQILFEDWEMTDMVVFWAPEDKEKGTVEGGTRIAVYLARHFDIPCYNLAIDSEREELFALVGFKESDYVENIEAESEFSKAREYTERQRERYHQRKRRTAIRS